MAPIRTIKHARRLRRKLSLPEVLLWQKLRIRPCYKFRRQYPEDAFACDFCCLSSRLLVEVDSEVHNRGNQPELNVRLGALMAERNYATQRVPAVEVLRNLEGGVTGMVARCIERGPPPPPLRGGPPARAGEE